MKQTNKQQQQQQQSIMQKASPQPFTNFVTKAFGKWIAKQPELERTILQQVAIADEMYPEDYENQARIINQWLLDFVNNLNTQGDNPKVYELIKSIILAGFEDIELEDLSSAYLMIYHERLEKDED